MPPTPASTARPRLLPLAAGLLLCACGGPGRVADKFVDRYYVESDQAAALPLAAGVAELRLRAELKLVAEGRAASAPMAAQQARVYWRRLRLEGEGSERTADYALDIRPQAGGEIAREAHLTLQQQGGDWRVTRFAEGAPR